MIDQLLAVRRNPQASFNDVADLGPMAFQIFRTKYGSKPSRWPMSALGPITGLFNGMLLHPEYQAWARFRSVALKRIIVFLIVHITRLKRRPGYNDFLITKWALLGDEESALELIARSKREDSIGCTACWALRSLSSQYPEFQERFAGEIPAPNVHHMLKDAPKDADPEAVLRRSKQVFGGSE